MLNTANTFDRIALAAAPSCLNLFCLCGSDAKRPDPLTALCEPTLPPAGTHTRSVRMDFNTVELLVEEQNTPSAQQTNQNRENVDTHEDLKIKQVWVLHDGGGGPTAGKYWGG